MVANRIPATNRLQPVTATTFVGQNSGGTVSYACILQ
jgi:hypothetical protein